MASIDYQGAKTEIESIFAKADTQRKIIFWYDAPMNFKDDIATDTFANCRADNDPVGVLYSERIYL